MHQKYFWSVIGLVLAFVTGFFILCSQRNIALKDPVVIHNIVVPPPPTLEADAVSQGEILYQQICAACHMPDLCGGPDWKNPLPDGALPPPPHDVGRF